MAATEVDIANLALANLGDDASIASLDPPEGSPQSEHCARFLPLARDVLLEAHAWGFATRRVAPALLTTTNDAWTSQYRLPADCLRVIGVLPDGYQRDDQAHLYFEIESDADGDVLLTNSPNATLRYVARVTDPTRYSATFTQALAWMLASYIAGPLLKGDVGAAAATTAWQVFLTWFARASSLDANQARRRLDHAAPWMIARSGWPEGLDGDTSYPIRSL